MKKIAPATSASRRVNPRRLGTPGLILLYLGRSIVEENDVADDHRVGRVGDHEAVGPSARRRIDRHLSVHVEADSEGSGLYQSASGLCARQRDERLVGAERKEVPGRVRAIDAAGVDDRGGGRVQLV